MRVLGAVTFESVLSHFAREHASDPSDAANTNAIAEDHLRSAQLASGGRWHRVRLAEAEVLRVVLPWHLGEGGEAELIPRTGLRVAAALARLAELEPTYARINPRCAVKLDWQRRAPTRPVFLSTRPVPGRDYAGLEVRHGLIHLDGLHRLLAWAQAGRLASPRGMPAYVAGLTPADLRHGGPK